MISHYIAIGLGGATGAVARIMLANALPASLLGIPFQILVINILGCFAMGFLVEFMGSVWELPETLKYFLISGFLGAFTTFSAFALDFSLLYQRHFYVTAFIYAGLTVVLSLMAFQGGMRLLSLFS